jgi:trans-2,3-dihydro-3-hydroxyanthranilate isomerase
LAAALSLDLGDLDVPGWRPEIWSCGVPFLVIPVRDRSALGRARLDLTRWEASIADSGGPNVYVVTPDPELPPSTLRARMFAPAMGIVEDPATGAAASALAGALAQHDATTTGRHTWHIEQGFEMGRPSVIEVEVVKSSGTVTGVRIGGACVMMGEGRLYST